MKPLPILWKRLVNEGETCPRCGSTGRNVLSAMAKLEPALRPLGILPVLETRSIAEDTFRAAPAESNRLWIAGQPMEAWLGARTGSSPCCEVCGDRPCRTMEVGGRTYEAIPEDLIIKAVLLAAAQCIGPGIGATGAPCCTPGCGCH